jgi:hypothetical protein
MREVEFKIGNSSLNNQIRLGTNGRPFLGGRHMNFSLRIVASVVLLARMVGAQMPGSDSGPAVMPKSNALSLSNGGMTLASTASQSSGPPVASTTSAEPTRSNAHSAVASEASRVADSIETVGFYNKLSYGYGGTFIYNTTPIVLFKSGEALYDMGALQFPGGLAAHKAAHPKDWTKWRRTGNAIEVIGKKGWERIAYTTTMDRLPPGFTFSGKYQMLSGGGNVALGGTVGIAVWRDLTFDTAGNFATGGGTGLSDSGSIEGTSTVLSTRVPERHGRYTIDGYALTLNYADGHVERRMIVTDPSDTKAIWLDGHGYVKQKQ